MKTKVALGIGFAILLVLTYPVLRRVGEVLAHHKPGVWGMPSWYILLIVSYAIFTLVLLAQALLFTLRRTYIWKQWAVLLMALTLVRGLLYGSVAPPWQAPDEHAHFEYAALMGQLKRVPTPDDTSPELQRQIVTSMFDYDLWRLIKREPVASPPEGFLVAAGISDYPPTHVIDNRYLYYPQVGIDPPLYYVAPAIVYASLPDVHIALQLYAMRTTTVLMLVLLIGIVACATVQLFYDDSLLAVCVPAFTAFIPMLAHIGSVLNNDILAAVFSTALLGIVLGVRVAH